MKNFNYKDYYVMLEKQHNGSVSAIASADDDRFGVTFYDYPIAYIVRRMKMHCKHRIENNIKQI